MDTVGPNKCYPVGLVLNFLYEVFSRSFALLAVTVFLIRRASRYERLIHGGWLSRRMGLTC
jgi:hypothetical protein